ncbi:MAG: hypothetical protein ABSG00_01670 [Terracidiphilus sp.]|jgi:hypothetical protein
MALWAVLLAMLAAGTAGAQSGQGRVVVTVLARHSDQASSSANQQDLSVKVDGKDARITKWERYKIPNDNLEVVLLIDDSAISSLGNQFGEIKQFIRSLPPNAKAAIAYMKYGRAVFSGELTADHDQVLRGFHVPQGTPGSSASPYFCLSDLARHWPSTDSQARREVVMVTDGVDYYEMRYDPEDPYVHAAISDSVRANLVVYSIYWMNQGIASQTLYANYAGQNLLSEVTEATGGKSYWIGMGNPVSFSPYFSDIVRRFDSQYELRFDGASGSKPKVETLDLKLKVPGATVDAPQKVLVTPANPA